MTSLVDYIFPHRCVNCTRILAVDTIPLCVSCFHSLPLSHWYLNQRNPTFWAIYEHADILRASSLLLYQHNNAAKKLIMSNKYYNQPSIGLFLAELSKKTLASYEFDVITCIPSHAKTQRQRGYNQVEPFAQHLSKLLGIGLDLTIIQRVKRRDSQTHKNKEQRYKSLDNAFHISNNIHQYKRILLLDDVLTTGATLSSCCRSMLQKEPSVELSVFTMAKVV